MTCAQIIESARNNLNAVTDSLWSNTELLVKLYQVMLYVARETYAIEATDSSVTSTASTADYSLPSGALAISRLNYDGKKLQYVTERQWDELQFNTSTAPTGTPTYYKIFGTTVSLYPTPNTSALVLKFWLYKIPTAIPASSDTPTVPTEFHDVLVDGLTSQMTPKDLGHPLTLYWNSKYDNGVRSMRDLIKRRRRADRFVVVQTEECGITTNFGNV